MSPERPAAKPSPIQLRAVPTERIEPHLVAPARSGNVPRPLTSLIGRDAETVAALALLADDGVHLLTLTGPGGVGKTRLAVRIAEDAATAFADGVVFVPLAPIADPDLVLAAIAQALGLREVGGHPLHELITAYLWPRELLLILDNFEHLLPAAADVIDLLAACPRLTVLVTSRSVLLVSGEHDFPVPPLRVEEPGSRAVEETVRPPFSEAVRPPSSEAVQLFVARARAARPGFTLTTANADAVAEICRRLDGLPLAIELAAARIRLLSPEALLARLERQLSLLTGGPRDAPRRLRTMRDAIAWSHELLTAEERILFRCLAVFAGGFTLKGAEGVGGERGTVPSVFDLVASLVDHSLLRRVEPMDAEPRYAMLETVREYAAEQLNASGEEEEIRRRHAAHYLALAERAAPTWYGPSQRAWLDRLERELNNLRAALDWAKRHVPHTAAIALNLAAVLWGFWQVRHPREGRERLERLLAITDDTEAPLASRAMAIAAAGILAFVQYDNARAKSLYLESLTLWRHLANDGAAAQSLFFLSQLALRQGEVERAAALAAEASALAEMAGERNFVAASQVTLGLVARARGQAERARELLEGALALMRDHEFSWGTAWVLHDLAEEARDWGDVARAIALRRESLAIFGELEDGRRVGEGLTDLGILLAGRAEPEGVAYLLGAADALQNEFGDPIATELLPAYDRAVDTVQGALGAAAFAAAFAAGQQSSLAAAVAHAVALSARCTEPDKDAGGARQVARTSDLTPREQEILRLLVAGWPDKEIAAQLGVGRRTVSNHVATIRAKLDAPSRSAAAAIAMRDHLV